MTAYIDITGKKYGRLTVVRRNGWTKHKHTAWDCICDCGNELLGVAKCVLSTGNTKSCGCLVTEMLVARNSSHGKSRTNLYQRYLSIKARCNIPSAQGYKYYGGRGIKCLWESFEDFEIDMGDEFNKRIANGEKISIDRIDHNGHYCKENCRWADDVIQANNKRSNHYLEYKGQTKSLTEWAREFGSTQERIRARLKLGFTVEEALTFKRNQYRKYD